MLRKLIALALFLCVCFALLKFGGYSFDSFGHEVHIRDPKEVLSPYIPSGGNNNNNSTTNNGNGYTFDPNLKIGGGSDNATTTSAYTFDPNNSNADPNVTTNQPAVTTATKETTPAATTTKSANDNSEAYTGLVTAPADKKQLAIEFTRIFKINLNGKEIELSSKNTLSFLKWLNKNYSDDAKVEITAEDKPDLSNVDNSTILNGEDLTKIISSVNTVKSLPTYNDYDRTIFEKPVKTYKLNDSTTNRNDYAWKTSPYFNEKDYTYTCPYTGKIIKDSDDKKDDKDFGTVDYDHIVPLKSAYLRGAKNWTNEQKNAYAYDQSVGVDVLNSANRSKGDKGPAEWLPDVNRGSYCYSWLVICNKYNLSMTEEEIKICNDEINKAIKNGETVTFMGGKYTD